MFMLISWVLILVLVRDAVIAAGWCCSLLRADIALDFDGEHYFDKLASDLGCNC